MKRRKIRPKFVELIPEALREGVLYISFIYATASHRCPCGCGEKVVTPIGRVHWTLSWDGETVSLYPSIGNWSLPCRSHYWITENRVVWAKRWGKQEISESRESDKQRIANYYRTGKRK